MLSIDSDTQHLTGLARATICKAVKALEGLGLLVVVRRIVRRWIVRTNGWGEPERILTCVLEDIRAMGIRGLRISGDPLSIFRHVVAFMCSEGIRSAEPAITGLVGGRISDLFVSLNAA